MAKALPAPLKLSKPLRELLPNKGKELPELARFIRNQAAAARSPEGRAAERWRGDRRAEHPVAARRLEAFQGQPEGAARPDSKAASYLPTGAADQPQAPGGRPRAEAPQGGSAGADAPAGNTFARHGVSSGDAQRRGVGNQGVTNPEASQNDASSAPFVRPPLRPLSDRNPWRPSLVEARHRARERMAAMYEGMAVAALAPFQLQQAELTDLLEETPKGLAITDDERRVRRGRRWLRRADALRRCEHDIVATVPTAAGSRLVVNPWGVPLVRRVRCGSRFCCVCARKLAAARRRRLARRLEDFGQARDFVLVTLTRKRVQGEALEAAAGALRAGLLRLRKDPWFLSQLDAALVSLEVTWSTPRTRGAIADRLDKKAADIEDIVGDQLWERTEGDEVACNPLAWQALQLVEEARALRERRGAHWHAHVHLLIRPKVREHGGRWLPWNTLRATWAKCLDVEEGECGARVERPRAGLDEVAKYVVKPAEVDNLPDEQLRELLTYWEGRRQLACWGTWYGDQGLKEALGADDGAPDGSCDVEAPVPPCGTGGDLTLGWQDGEDHRVRFRDVVWRHDVAALDVAAYRRALAWEAMARASTLPEATGPPPPPGGASRAAHVAAACRKLFDDATRGNGALPVRVYQLKAPLRTTT